MKTMKGSYMITQPVQQLAVAAWLGFYLPCLFITVRASTTQSSDSNVTTTVATETTTTFNLLIYLPQSAISLLSLAAFIGISIGAAWLAEKCYERLSLRDDSSDMSEHTKEILRARILGMVFKKTLDINNMTEKEKEVELVKKYAHLWQYKAAMKRNRRKEELKKKTHDKRKGSIFSFFSSSSNDDKKEKEEAKAAAAAPAKPPLSRTISKKPSQMTIPEDDSPNSPTKSKRETVEEDFVAIEMKDKEPAAAKPSNAKTNSINNKTSTTTNNTATVAANKNSVNKKDFTTVNVTHNDTDEFDFADMQFSSKKGDNGSIKHESSMNKYMRPPSSLENSKTSGSKVTPTPNPVSKNEPVRNVSRPLTAGASRPITAGAKRANTEYKSQGNSVKKEVFNKKLVQFD